MMIIYKIHKYNKLVIYSKLINKDDDLLKCLTKTLVKRKLKNLFRYFKTVRIYSNCFKVTK
jgi:hypothetical protein